MENKLSLITGASSGIGKAYAEFLASLGNDLILVARRENVLNQIAGKIKETFKVNVTCCPADLSGHEGVMKVKEMIESGMKPGVLINAAGFGTRGFFHEVDPDTIERQIYLMTVASTILARSVLPDMVKRKEGIVVFVSSVAAYISTAQYPAYSSAKMFINTFVTGLRDELAATEIKVQSVCPGLTRTEFMYTDQYKDFDYSFVPDKFWMNPEEVVEYSWKRLTKNYKPVIVTGRANKFLVAILNSPFIGYLFKRKISNGVRKKIRKGLPLDF